MNLTALALALALNATSTAPSRGYQAQVEARLHAAFNRAAALGSASKTEPSAKPAQREGRTPRPAGR